MPHATAALDEIQRSPQPSSSLSRCATSSIAAYTRVFANELAPARGDRSGLGGRALDAQHYVGHRLQPLRRDRLPALVAQPIRAFVELGQRTLRALQVDLQ